MVTAQIGHSRLGNAAFCGVCYRFLAVVVGAMVMLGCGCCFLIRCLVGFMILLVILTRSQRKGKDNGKNGKYIYFHDEVLNGVAGYCFRTSFFLS